jgi:hypothetical protein
MRYFWAKYSTRSSTGVFSSRSGSMPWISPPMFRLWASMTALISELKKIEEEKFVLATLEVHNSAPVLQPHRASRCADLVDFQGRSLYLGVSRAIHRPKMVPASKLAAAHSAGALPCGSACWFFCRSPKLLALLPLLALLAALALLPALALLVAALILALAEGLVPQPHRQGHQRGVRVGRAVGKLTGSIAAN